MADTDRLIEVTLDDSGLPPPSTEVEQERRVALYDLTQENAFGLPGREDAPRPPAPTGSASACATSCWPSR